MTPRVSVLMPVYNAAEYLQQAIDSVRAQTFAEWELLVMDDGSDDPRVGEMLASLYDEQGRIGVWMVDPADIEREASVRYATLINLGAETTFGDFLVFLPGDDFLMPDALERMVPAFDEDPSRSVVYGAQEMVELRDGYAFLGTRPADEPLTDAWHRVDMSQVMVRREAFNAVGGWQDTPPTPELWRQADAVFWRRLTSAGYVFWPVPGGPVSTKRYRPDSVDERVKRGETPWQSQS